jgi:AcrR family transcriptional regulator
MEAATRLFGKNGYEGVRTKEIAASAGVNETTLFKYFHRKEDLYSAILESYIDTLSIQSALPLLSYRNLERDVELLGNAIIDNSYANKSFHLMRQKERSDFMADRKFRIYLDPIYHELVPVFERYGQQGMLRYKPEQVATLLVRSLLSLFAFSVGNGESKEEFKPLLGLFLQTFSNGIQKEER